MGDKHLTVVSVAVPRTEAEDTAATAAATPGAGDVEMIKEKKEDGTDAAPAKGGAKAPAAAPAKADAKAGDKKPEAKAEKKK